MTRETKITVTATRYGKTKVYNLKAYGKVNVAEFVKNKMSRIDKKATYTVEAK